VSAGNQASDSNLAGRRRQARQLPFAAVLIGGVFLALATGLTIATLRGATDASHRTIALVANLEATIHEHAALELVAIARGALGEEEVAALRAARERSGEILADLAVEERASFGLAALRAALDGFRGAMDEQLSALGSGDLAAARAIEANRVSPARAAFDGVRAVTEARLATSAAESALAADVGTLTSLLAAAVLMSLLFRRWERLRRRSAFLVGEQRGLRESEARFRGLVQHSSDLITMVRRDGTLAYVSPSAERLLGMDGSALTGRTMAELLHPGDRVRLDELLATRTDWLEGRSVEWRLVTSTDQATLGDDWRTFESTASAADPEDPASPIILNSRDVTERRKLEESLRHQAGHDQLTGLVNRAGLIESLERALARAGRLGSSVGLLLVDLDAFKAINDSVGHLAGDGALSELAERLRKSVRADSVVARLGGDEFAVILEDLAGPEQATPVAGRIQAALARPLMVDGIARRVGASTGIAVSSAVLTTAGDLLAAADWAMYAAKRAGGARHVVFEGQLPEAGVA
jgi:diguanylate cyclase (GGDEF)-like protein/PAS domain S-box-containing protein